MKTIIKFNLLLLLSAASLSACKDEYNICNLPKDVRFIGGFYQKVNGVEVPSTVPNLSINILNSVVVYYNNQVNATGFIIPLNVITDSVKYVYNLDNNLPKDTVTLIYTTTTTFVSPECGNISTHNIVRCYSTLNTIDSIKIINPSMNTSNPQNVKVYY